MASNKNIMRRYSDWYCSQCTFSIFGSKSACKKCGSMRPESALNPLYVAPKACDDTLKKKKGDWDCALCGIMNFASRDVCFKCFKAKPEGKGSNQSIKKRKAGVIDSDNCTICMDNVANVMIITCRHICMCADCLGQMKTHTCPMCRKFFNESEAVVVYKT